MIRLIKSDNTLELLIDKDKIQQTEWFMGLGEIKDERLKSRGIGIKKAVLRQGNTRHRPYQNFI